MYHIGIIRHVILPGAKGISSADMTIQAVVRMWDENLLILLVDKKIGKRIKKGDYVLCDYTPMSPDSKYRKLHVIKRLPPDMGKAIWREFEREYSRRKAMLMNQSAPTPPIRYIR